MTIADNPIGSAVFWARLPWSVATSVLCYVLLDISIPAPLVPGVGNPGVFLVITILYFLAVQVAVHWLMVGMNSQVYGRAPKRIDIRPGVITCWIPPPRRALSDPEGFPMPLEVPFDHITQVNPLGFPGVVAPFARVRAAGLDIPKDFFLGGPRENFLIVLTRANALSLRAAWATWNASSRPLPSSPLA